MYLVLVFSNQIKKFLKKSVFDTRKYNYPKKIAKNKHLFITMGSDYHFTDQIHPMIGLLNEDFHVTDQQKIRMLDHILD